MRIRILLVFVSLAAGCSKPQVAPSPVAPPPPSQVTPAPSTQRPDQTSQPSQSSERPQATDPGQPPSDMQIIDSLDIDDVAERCGKPDDKQIGLVSYYAYSNAFNTGPVVGDAYSRVVIWFRGSDVKLWKVEAYPHGSNHSRPIDKYFQLPKVLPCLLKGGIAR
jgi:hypothetical protein